MAKFERPELLNLLFLIPLFLALVIAVWKLKKKQLAIYASENLSNIVYPDWSSIKSLVKGILIVFSFGLIILAIANPLIGLRMEEVKQKGIDLFIAIDVSNSMRAEDIKPNRLETAKNRTLDLIRKLKGDRIGLIVFAGDAFVQMPLTFDYSAARMFLNTISFNSVSTQGTNVAKAIDLAIRSFNFEENTSKAIVIFTDGEDHEGEWEAMAKEAKGRGVKIYCIGIGSPVGTPIPIYNNQGQLIGFKKDSYGNVVMTKLDEMTLAKISEIADGKYFRAEDSRNELDLIYDELKNLQKSEISATQISEFETRFYYFLAPAFILLLIETLTFEKKSIFLKLFLNKIGLNKKDQSKFI